MGKSKYIANGLILIIILVNYAPGIFAEVSYKKTFYTTYINREMDKWGNLIHSIEVVKEPASIEQKLEYIDYYYGYIGHLIEKKQYNAAQIELNRGQKLINEVIRISPQNATAYSYKGAFVGFRIGISKLKHIYLWPEINKNVYKAYAIDSLNIQAITDIGNIYFYYPCLLGGDKKEALNYYLKALKLFENNKNTIQNWRYIDLLINIAITYDKINLLKESKLTYEKILRKEPNCKLVRDVLYPTLLTKLKN